MSAAGPVPVQWLNLL